MKRILPILITLLLIPLIFVEPVSAEVIEETIEVEVGEEFWFNVRGQLGINDSYTCERSDYWYWMLDNDTLYGESERAGVYWLNVTTDEDIYHIRIVVANKTSTITTSEEEPLDMDAISPATVLIVAGTVLVASTILFGMTDVGKWAFMSLFNKLTKKRILSNKTRAKVYRYIELHPGTCLFEIRRGLDIPYSSLYHHIRKLKEHDYIRSKRDGVYIRFWIERHRP